MLARSTCEASAFCIAARLMQLWPFICATSAPLLPLSTLTVKSELLFASCAPLPWLAASATPDQTRKTIVHFMIVFFVCVCVTVLDMDEGVTGMSPAEGSHRVSQYWEQG